MKKKVVVSLGLSAVVAASMALGAFAATNTTPIKALLNKSLKIKVNGSVLPLKDASGKPTFPITYNGTTYLPVRSIGESMGVKVGFDAKQNTVLLGETPNAAGTTTVGLSRKNPAPIGKAVLFHKKDFMEDYQGTFQLERVVRGDEAFSMLRQRDDSVSAPAAGYEYLLAKLTVGVVANTKLNASADINDTMFTLVSSAGKDYQSDYIILPPTPTLDAHLYAGASDTGWAAFVVNTNDTNPLLTFGRQSDGTGGVWFQTK